MDINQRASLVDCAPIKLAAVKGREEIVRRLIERGATLDVSEPTRNALFGAIYGRSIGCVKLLLEAGIDARARYTGQRMKNMDAAAFADERGEKEIAAFIRDFLSKHPKEKELK
jgi:ankyrin repeat protein